MRYRTLGLLAACFAVLSPSTVASAQDSDFAGLKFGVGISMTFDTGKNKRVDAASVDANGIVRIDKASNTPARIMLESHYFFNMKAEDRGWGPFMALQPGSDEVVNALGMGVMVGFRRGSDDGLSDQSFNIGIGYVIDPQVQVLGEEFRENAAAPLGPGATPMPIRYRTIDQGGALLLFSFSW